MMSVLQCLILVAVLVYCQSLFQRVAKKSSKTVCYGSKHHARLGNFFDQERALAKPKAIKFQQTLDLETEVLYFFRFLRCWKSSSYPLFFYHMQQHNIDS